MRAGELCFVDLQFKNQEVEKRTYTISCNSESLKPVCEPMTYKEQGRVAGHNYVSLTKQKKFSLQAGSDCTILLACFSLTKIETELVELQIKERDSVMLEKCFKLIPRF